MNNLHLTRIQTYSMRLYIERDITAFVINAPV